MSPVPADADVIVAGLGAMGSLAAWRLARAGLGVRAFDRYRPPHGLGSSHGGSRVIRELAFEHPRYVPLVRRAYPLWEELAGQSGAALLRTTGALYAGAPTSSVVDGSRASAVAHGIASDSLDAEGVRARWPAFAPSPGMVGLFEHRAGVLHPEACVSAALAAAQAAGALLHLEEPILSWQAAGGAVQVTTPEGTYAAGRLVLATGPWIVPELETLGVHLEVERVIQHWFRPARDAALLEPGRCPIYMWEDEEQTIFYGFPLIDGAVKCAVHHRGERTTIEAVRRGVSEAEVERARDLLARFVPPAAGAHVRSAVCVYTNTADGDFLLDRHPAHPEVLLVSPCAGIGFKFAPVIGEIVTDLVRGRDSGIDLSPFRLARLTP